MRPAPSERQSIFDRFAIDRAYCRKRERQAIAERRSQVDSLRILKLLVAWVPRADLLPIRAFVGLVRSTTLLVATLGDGAGSALLFGCAIAVTTAKQNRDSRKRCKKFHLQILPLA